MKKNSLVVKVLAVGMVGASVFLLRKRLAKLAKRSSYLDKHFDLEFFFNDGENECPQSEATDTVAPIATKPAMEPPKADPFIRPEDDLKRIEGIGPKTEKILKSAGIMNFQQLAALNIESLAQILKNGGLRIIKCDSWIPQAKLASQEKWAELQAMQDEL